MRCATAAVMVSAVDIVDEKRKRFAAVSRGCADAVAVMCRAPSDVKSRRDDSTAVPGRPARSRLVDEFHTSTSPPPTPRNERTDDCGQHAEVREHGQGDCGRAESEPARGRIL